jgi:ABC-type iron transport system FetAB permease component
MDTVMFCIGSILAVVASYIIAKSICQRFWKEKISHAKLIGFTSIFVVSLTILLLLILAVWSTSFGRTKPVLVPPNQNLSNP